MASISSSLLPQIEGLRTWNLGSSRNLVAASVGVDRRHPRRMAVRAATALAAKYTSIKPLGDRLVVKIKDSEDKTTGGILLPTTAQSKPQGGEVIAIGDHMSAGNVDSSVQVGAKIIYSKYAGTEVEFNDSKHMILKEDDIVGILGTDDIKDLKPLNERVLIKVAEVEDKTPGGVLLSPAVKEKSSSGTVIAVGPGHLDEEGKRKALAIEVGSTVLYSKFAGNDFKGADGTNYIVIRASDIMAVLSDS